jgi:hypothetical protein
MVAVKLHEGRRRNVRQRLVPRMPVEEFAEEEHLLAQRARRRVVGKEAGQLGAR